MKRKRSEDISHGLIKPHNVSSCLAAIGYRIETLGRSSGKPPSAWLEPLGIVLDTDILDEWDYVPIGQYADIEMVDIAVSSPEFEQEKVFEYFSCSNSDDKKEDVDED